MTETIKPGSKRILFLTENKQLIAKQLAGENIGIIPVNQLLERASTDLYPTKACFRFDADYMASQAFTGLQIEEGRWVPENAVREGNFGVIAAGADFGCGSSREHFPWSIKLSGITTIVAPYVARIFRQNCENIGLYCLQGDVDSFVKRLAEGEGIPVSEITQKMDHISAEVVRSGGLFPFFQHYPDLDLLPKPETEPRPMTGPEKAIARKMGVPYVAPGDNGFLAVDYHLTTDIFAAMAYQIAREQQPGSRIKSPKKIYAYNDHALLAQSLDAQRLASLMRQIALDECWQLFDGDCNNGAVSICHEHMRHTVLPGEVVSGTDSHTTTSGALQALAIGVGSTEAGAAFLTDRLRIAVPPSIKFELCGKPDNGVMAKDIMLYLLSALRHGESVGRICEYGGEVLDYLSFDEASVLTNMTAELGGYFGWIRPSRPLVHALMEGHHLTKRQAMKLLIHGDPDSEYEREIRVDVSTLEPYIALPGNPTYGKPFSEIFEDSHIDKKIQKAVIVGCAGSKLEDIRQVARVLEGRRVHPDVQMFIYTASRRVRTIADKLGWTKIITEAGAMMLPTACGACVNFGPGTVQNGERGITSANRNFKGRMGPGDMFLANPAVVAASAVAGEITLPSYL